MLQTKQKNYRDSRIKLYQQAIEDRNASYERLIENEDALRRAVNFDKKYGTNYVKTYTKQLQNYAKSKNSPDLMQIGIKPMGANGSFDPNIPDYVFINSDYVKNGKLQPGLISHEKSHYDNQKAGALSLPIFDNRFVDTKKTKTMYPKTYDWIQRYLHNFEETKSHMNEFRTNMINKNLLKPDSKVGLKQILVSRYCLYDKEPDTEENEPEEDIDDAIDELKREINELKEIQ